MRVFAVSSGTIWARGSSSFSTVSTMSVLNVPDGWSSTVPMGTRESLSVSALRMLFRVMKAHRCEMIVEADASHTLPR